ncbi:MAG: alkaline phosphatase family protein [Planctomycetota bacterium]
MRPVIVICAVGLTPDHIGSDTPFLASLAGRGDARPLTSVVPAVTTSAQTTMLTGCDPQEHGIVANGWYFRDLAEVWLWRQSEALVQAPLLWHNTDIRVLKHCWWYAMNSSAAAVVTPRPVYHADGSKSPDCYTWPPELKDRLQQAHGTFPLFRFWGPLADITSSRWIADSFVTAWHDQRPDLGLVYLPHLDYDLQRHGPQGPHLADNLRQLDACCATVGALAEEAGAELIVVSEYGIEAVDRGVPINQHLRQRGLLTVTHNASGELLDPGMSPAFAVADHQLAHVYCRDEAATTAAAAALAELPGIERVYRGHERSTIGLDHPRSGELIAIAEAGCWFQYEYWLDPDRRPDFANSIEIHKKPGYDPRELFFDPQGGKRRAGLALLRKKLGLRYVLDPIPLDATVVGGSHGRPPADPGSGAVVITGSAAASSLLGANPHQRDIAALISGLLAS